MELSRDALKFIADLGVGAEKTEVLEINGKTYANRSLTRYDKMPKAERLKASTLSSLMDYIENCSQEFLGRMIIHIVSPTQVRLVSELDKEREREALFEVNAEISGFAFDRWYDQERFIIELQASFQETDDLKAVMKLAGNVVKKNEQNYTDDGMGQVATMTTGVASKSNVIVPNPVELIPYRTFREVGQPASKFVFRMGDKEVPAFEIVEAEGNIWKNEAVENIKEYFYTRLSSLPEDISGKILVIG